MTSSIKLLHRMEELPEKLSSSFSERNKASVNLCGHISKLGYPTEIHFNHILYPEPLITRSLLGWLYEMTSKDEPLSKYSENISAFMNETWKVPCEEFNVRKNGCWNIEGRLCSNRMFGDLFYCGPSIVTRNKLQLLTKDSRDVSLLMKHALRNDNKTKKARECISRTHDCIENQSVLNTFEINDDLPLLREKEFLSDAVLELQKTLGANQILSEQISNLDSILNERKKHLCEMEKTQKATLGASDIQIIHLNNEIAEIENRISKARESFEAKREPLVLKLHACSQVEESREKKISDISIATEEMKTSIREMSLRLLSQREKQKVLETVLDNMDRSISRRMHTTRIFDLIHQIRKQDNEISRVIADIRVAQTDINQISSRLVRSEAIANEIQDSVARTHMLDMRVLFDKLILVAKDTGKTVNRARDSAIRADAARRRVPDDNYIKLLEDINAVKIENVQLEKSLRTD